MFELNISTGGFTVVLRFSEERPAKLAFKAAETANNKSLSLVLFGKEGEVLQDIYR